MRTAAEAAAPPGKERAVVLVPTIVGTLRQWDEGAGNWEIVTSGKRKAVLSVNVPGRAPYAVLAEKFNRPRNKTDKVSGAGLPALVSSGDPTDVEILWDEVPELEAQLGQRISDGLQAAQAGIEAEQQMGAQITAAAQQASANPGAIPAPGGGMPLSPQLKQQMAMGARQALQFVQDPAQRKMLIEQYRRAGIELEESE